MTTVFPRPVSSRKKVQNAARSSGSTPTVGSSSRRRSGSWSRAAAREGRRRIPPDRVEAMSSRRPALSTSFRASPAWGGALPPPPLRDVHELQDLCGAAVDCVFVHPDEATEAREVLFHREVEVDCEVLRHVADARQDGPRRDGLTEDLGLARRRGGEAEPEAGGGGLARALLGGGPERHAPRAG